jgi:uncharacterized protein
MFFFPGYGLYMLFALPALLLGLWAQFRVQSAFNKYSKVRTYTGLTGADIARRMLDSFGLGNIEVQQTGGFLSDHYDPGAKVLRLSPGVFQSNSIAAAGVAAHEAGHAVQDKDRYPFMSLRAFMVPTAQIGSWLGPIIFLIGYFLNSAFGDKIALAGLIAFGLTALFAIVTLPVELNATSRAKAWLTDSGVIYGDERKGVNAVLDAAALTYVAAAIQAITTMLYYAFLLFGRRRR